ncbi:MAG: GyrI-like domain-containing protein [Bacteroidales bacterium]|nr:GyrI-like domain-containing protein [Bacteroidales bacterium]
MKKAFVLNLILAGMFFLYAGSVSVFSQDTGSKSVIEVIQVDAQKAVVLKSEVPSNAVGPAMGKAYEALYGYVMSNNITPAGPPFAVYYSYDPNGNTVFEAGVPVNGPVDGNDEIVYKEFPAMKVVSTQYKGAYEAMENVYSELTKYMTDNRLESTGTSWEVYMTDPSQVTDPNDNETLIYFPVKE